MKHKHPLIYIIYGASGSGKTTLLSQIQKLREDVTIQAKATTRGLREYDDEEIISLGEESIEKEYDYVYTNYGYTYGIQRSQIDDSLEKGKHHFIICNDKETIRTIRRDYANKVRVLYLMFDTPEIILRQIQKERNISDDEINLRVEKIKILNDEFVRDKSFFDAVIMNKFGTTSTRLLSQLLAIIDSESEKIEGPDINDIKLELAAISEMIAQIKDNTEPKIKDLKNISQKDFAFIVMAMITDDPFLDDIHAAIKRACANLKYNAERVDESSPGGDINQKVLTHIRLSEIIIADLTHERPNVYYELGYSHAFGKKTIISAKKGTRVHFDLVTYDTIFYESASELERKLTEKLTKLRRGS